MNKQEEDIIKKYANAQISKDFLQRLDKIKEIIDRGSIEYTKCQYCKKLIEDWREAMDLIDKTKSELKENQK